MEHPPEKFFGELFSFALLALAFCISGSSSHAQDEEEALAGLPIWMLYAAKTVADGNRYFDPNHIDLVVPESLWSDAPSSSLEHAIPIDFDNDGLMDLFIEQALAWDGPGGSIPNPNSDLYAPSNVVRLAYKQTTAGVYQLATREIFGVELVEIGDLSRKWVSADFNDDGYVDILGCLTREDGREMSYEQGY